MDLGPLVPVGNPTGREIQTSQNADLSRPLDLAFISIIPFTIPALANMYEF